MMHATTTLPLLTALALGCSGSGAQSSTDGEALAAPLSRSLDVLPERPLVAYAWDTLPAIPANFETNEAHLAYGEAGLAKEDLTRLYLTLNEGAGERAADVSGTTAGASLDGATWTRGRFGNAVRLERKDARLVVEEVPGFPEAVWCIEMWIRPSEDNSGLRHLVSVPGAFEIMYTAKNKLSVRFHQGGENASLGTKQPLIPGQWNHVAMAVDTELFTHARLVVNGVLTRRNMESVPFDATSTNLLVGGMSDEVRGFLGEVDDLRIGLRPLSTASLRERFEERAANGAHTLRLEYADGTEEIELWQGIVDESVLAGPALAEGALRHALLDEHALRPVPGHWEADPRMGPLMSRTTQPVVYMGNHEAFLFGGETTDSDTWPFHNTNDTWVYDIAERSWTEVHGEPRPNKACHQGAAYSPDHDIVLYAGGYNNDDEGLFAYDDTWAFHVDERRWEKLEPGGVDLPPSSDCAIVYHTKAKRFLLFRGQALYIYDPTANTWELRKEAESQVDEGPAPPFAGRGSAMVAYDERADRVFIFGGEARMNGEGFYTDTVWIYDYDAHMWTFTRPPRSPSPRARGGVAYDSKRGYVVLFGGVRDQHSTRFNDLWIYRVDENLWEQVDASNMPSNRGGYYGMAYDPELDQFTLLAGRHAPRSFLNGAWHLRLDPEAEGRATYVFDRESRPELDGFFTEWIGTEPELRFAGSEDGLAWTDWGAEPASARYAKVEVSLIPGEDESRLFALGFADLDELRGTGEFVSVRRTILPAPSLQR